MFNHLFSYEDLQEACGDCFAFNNVVLKQPLGTFPIGSKLSSVWFYIKLGTDKQSEVEIFETEDDACNGCNSVKFPFKVVVG